MLFPMLLACSGARPATITPTADDCLTLEGEAGPWAGSIWLDDWYAVQQLDCDTYILAEPDSNEYNVSYLLLGDERAVLFDTGAGQRSMAEAVGTLTTLPVTAVLSHFHYDHVGNIDEFDHYAFIDLPDLRARTDASGSFTFTRAEVLASQPETVQVGEWWADGAAVDLGGRTVSLLSAPGHTPESVLLIDRDRRLLFTGDVLYNDVLLAIMSNSSLTDYRDTAARMVAETVAETGAGYRVFGAHGTPENDPERLTTLAALTDGIVAGTAEGTGVSAFGLSLMSWSLKDVTLWTLR